MKKRLSLILALVLCVSLAGCASTPQNQNEETLKLNLEPCVGKTLPEVCELLNAEEADITENSQVMRHDFNAKTEFAGHQFTRYLCFGDKDGEKLLYGGGYETVVESKGEELEVLIDELKNTLIDTCGEPTTYPGHGGALGDKRDFSDVTFDNFIEDWSLNDSKGGQIRLTVAIREERALVTVQYSAASY